MQETLRLCPPVATDMKEVVRECTLPSGVHVYPGDHLFYNITGVQRHPDYWRRAEEFWPDRWLDRQDRSLQVEAQRQNYFTPGM